MIKHREMSRLSIRDVSLAHVGIAYPMYQWDVHPTYVICTQFTIQWLNAGPSEDRENGTRCLKPGALFFFGATVASKLGSWLKPG